MATSAPRVSIIRRLATWPFGYLATSSAISEDCRLGTKDL